MRAAGGQCDSNEEPEGSGMRPCDRRSSRSVDCFLPRPQLDGALDGVIRVLSSPWAEDDGICGLWVM
jgi:hypothetical protein